MKNYWLYSKNLEVVGYFYSELPFIYLTLNNGNQFKCWIDGNGALNYCRIHTEDTTEDDLIFMEKEYEVIERYAENLRKIQKL
jgi:hypothetical protein